MDKVEITPAVIRFSAMNLLAMREHSALELQNKLLQKFGGAELSEKQHSNHLQESITAAIETLTTDGLQSDLRFAEAFIIMRQRQGKGPVLIRMELKERGIDSEVALNLLNAADEVWNQIAKKVFTKKFGDRATQDKKQLSKQMRFLVARGFNSANIQYVLKNVDPSSG